MADTADDKEKAEKVAAARKRYEQLKKQKAKKAGDTGATTTTTKSKKTTTTASKDDKPATTDETSTPAIAEPEDDDVPAAEADEDVAAAADDDAAAQPSTHTRQPSISLQSQMRSSSFRSASGILSATSPTGGLKSPPLPPLSADQDSVQEIYRKQAARIEGLEKDNKRLEKELEDLEGAKAKMEEELEEMRESRADVVASTASGVEKGGEVDKLRTEIVSLQRQNAQLSAQAREKRRPSGNVPLSSSATEDLNTQLADKTSTLESLELEISNLRHSLSESQATTTTLKARITELEASLKTAEEASEEAQRDVVDMRARLESTSNPNSSTSTTSTSTTADANRIALLTSDLHTAQRTAVQAQTRASNLEKKIETLSTLHRESESRQHAQFTARSKEMERLRSEAAEMRKKVSSVSNENARLRERRARGDSISSGGNRPLTADSSSEGGAGGSGGDFAGLAGLQARVRELEAENTDLRRGVWRDRRREMQDEGLGDDNDFALASPNGGAFDDVDLSSAPSSAYRRRSTPYNALGFTNIINTFTGRDSASTGRAPGGGGASRRGSSNKAGGVSGFFGPASGGELGGLEEDEDGDLEFDEDAFRAAQEEQARMRLERVKEVKRGLDKWRGWRVDLVELRGGAAAGVFDV